MFESHRRWAYATLLVVAASCSGATETADDAGDLDAPGPATLEVETPRPPAAPWPVGPEGWVEVSDGGWEPWAAGEGSCPSGTLRFPDGLDCAPLGPPCADEFADVPSGVAIFVSATALEDGDGSRARPFRRISDAVSAARAGSTIALSVGTHTTTFIEMPAGVALVGACASRTHIESTHEERGRAVITTQAGEVSLRGLSITANSLIGIVARGERLRLEGVSVNRARGIGVLALRGLVSGTDVLVSGIRPDSAGGAIGLVAVEGSQMELSRVRVEESTLLARQAGSRLRLDQAVLFAPPTSRAAVIDEGGTLELARSLVESGTAVVAFGEGSRMVVRDVVVRGLEGGLAIGLGAELDGQRLMIAETSNGNPAVLVSRGARGTLSDLVVRDSGTVATLGDSELVVERAHFQSVRGAALLTGRGSTLRARDVTVRGTVPSNDLPYALAVLAAEDADLDVERLVSVDNGGGILIGASRGRLVDVHHRRSQANDDALLTGIGLVVADGATVTAERNVYEHSRTNGISVADVGTDLDARDVVVRMTEERVCASGCDGFSFGSGVVVSAGARARLERFEVSNSVFCGLRVLTGASLELRRGLVTRNPIGVDLDDPNFDVARIAFDVVFLDNERNLARSDRPAPTIVVPELSF